MGKGGHGGGFAGATHSHDPDYPEDTFNLYQHVSHCEALNSATPSAAPGVLRPHARRLEPEPVLVSEGDHELMIKIFFSSPVHVRRIMIIGSGDDGHHPAHMKAFVNRDELDFSSAEDVVPAQQFDLAPNHEGEGYVLTRQAPFTNITSLVLLIDANCGDLDETRLAYIGLQGDHTHDRREAVHADYELMCQHADHPSVPDKHAASLGSS